MRGAFRLFASIKTGQYLEAGAPTGLTGLLTHNSPRSTLLYLYNSTLDKLKHIPEASVYRQSTEALTRHRLKIIEAAKPPGWDEWANKVNEQVKKDPEVFAIYRTSGGTVVDLPDQEDIDPTLKAAEWDGEVGRPFPEGIRSEQARRPYVTQMAGPKEYEPEREASKVKLDPEPQLTADVYVGDNVHLCDVLIGIGFPRLRARSVLG